MINQTVLMSGADYYSVQELNPYSHTSDQPVVALAQVEHAGIRQALEGAGVSVIQVPAPADCQDGVYTANWGLCRGDSVILASLPNVRQAEQAYAEAILRAQGKRIIKAPYRFSGQGDALPCGQYLLMGNTYRTDRQMQAFIADELGYQVISLTTIPEVDGSGQPVINTLSGWPDSFFYDIDLAISVLTPQLIAWCPAAFMPDSQDKIKALPLGKIEVSLSEAMNGFACNLVSTGSTVIMSARAPQLQAAIEAHGISTTILNAPELAKGGGFIRCTTLTLDN